MAVRVDSNAKSQCWSVVAVLYRALVSIFFIYCHLTLPCFCITPFDICSSPCIKLYILCSGFYCCLCLWAIHIAFPSLQYSVLQFSFGSIIRFLVSFHVHILCLAFFVSNHFEFLFQSFWNLYNIGC